MSEHRTILRAAGLVGAITLLSRLTGLVRDVLLAAVFGASRAYDVFLTAFELSNLVRRVLGEGSLSSFIVPLLHERRAAAGEAAGWRWLNITVNFMLALSLVLTLLGMVFSREVFVAFGGLGLLHGASGPASAGEAAWVALGTHLTRLMFPFVIGLTVGSVLMGACHALSQFGPPAFGSVLLNIAMIAAGALALVVHPGPERAAHWLAWSVLAGAAGRLILLAVALARRGWRWRPAWAPRDPDLRRLLAMMGPGVLALAVSQINLSVAGIFGMWLGEGIKSCIVSAGRLIQFPMALTATAAATAMLPQVAECLRAGREDELRGLLALSKRLEIILMMPAMFGLIILGLPIVRLVFEHGRWTAQASHATWLALLGYAPGLLPLGWARLLEPIFYARQDRWTPLKAAAVSMVVNLALNAYFAFFTTLAVVGLALANTAAAYVYYFLLSRWVERIFARPLGERPRLGETLAKTAAAALVACGAGLALYLGANRLWGEPAHTAGRALRLLPVIGLTAALHFALVRIWRVPDAQRVTEKLLRKLKGSSQPQ